MTFVGVLALFVLIVAGVYAVLVRQLPKHIALPPPRPEPPLPPPAPEPRTHKWIEAGELFTRDGRILVFDAAEFDPARVPDDALRLEGPAGAARIYVAVEDRGGPVRAVVRAAIRFETQAPDGRERVADAARPELLGIGAESLLPTRWKMGGPDSAADFHADGATEDPSKARQAMKALEAAGFRMKEGNNNAVLFAFALSDEDAARATEAARAAGAPGWVHVFQPQSAGYIRYLLKGSPVAVVDESLVAFVPSWESMTAWFRLTREGRTIGYEAGPAE